jgi:hypothetical protein
MNAKLEGNNVIVDAERFLIEIIGTKTFAEWIHKQQNFLISRTFLSDDFDSFVEIINRNEGDIKAVLYELSEVKKGIDILTEQQKAEFLKLNEKIEVMDSKIDKINEKYNKLDKKFNIALIIIIFLIILSFIFNVKI